MHAISLSTRHFIIIRGRLENACHERRQVMVACNSLYICGLYGHGLRLS